MKKVKGIFAAMMTPFDENGSISEKKIMEMMEFFMEKELDGIFPVSNVGEFAVLTYKEKCQIIKTCVSVADGKMQVWPGVTDLNLDKAVELSYFAGECKADGIILSSPYYYPYGTEYVQEYMKRFLDKTPLPVVLYHSPKFANPIHPKFLMELLRHPKVVGIKESSGDAKFLIWLLGKIREEDLDISVMIGWEELLLTGLIHGADGCIVSSGGIVPEILRKIYGCFLKKEMGQALQGQQSICRITEKMGSYGLPYGYKAGMAARVPMQILQSKHMESEEKRLQKAAVEIRNLLKLELDKV